MNGLHSTAAAIGMIANELARRIADGKARSFVCDKDAPLK